MHDGVMPYCYGSVCGNSDEWDLLHCTCDPKDPMVAHVDLISRTDTLISLLREKRRDRRADLQAAKRLLAIARTMQNSIDQRGLREAWKQVESIGNRFVSIASERERKSA